MRTLLRWSLCVVLGMAMTVAIAWGVSLQTAAGLVVRPSMTFRHRDQARGEGTGWLRAENMYKFGWTCTSAQATPLSWYEKMGIEPTTLTPDQLVSAAQRRLALPWLDGAAPWPGPDAAQSLDLNSYGWPWRAMYNRRVHNGAGRADTDHLLDLSTIPWFAGRPASDMKGLPVGILRTGFMADVGLWSFVWAALLIGPGAIRRHARRRGGRCLRCGYDLRAQQPGTECPECGAAVVR